MLNVVTVACLAKGWKTKVEHVDEKHWKHASVTASRVYPDPSSFAKREVACLIEVSLNGQLKWSTEVTSGLRWGARNLKEAIGEALREGISWVAWDDPQDRERGNADEQAVLDTLLRLLRRFDRVARQLLRRRQSRETLRINDEYDAQDLLHALLRGWFDDVRAEEPTPSRAGAAARVDFLLKESQIVVEVKLVTARVDAKAIGEELIIDIDRYASHPDCRTLVCFVYDPEYRLENPEALERDLTGDREEMEVRVVVAPR